MANAISFLIVARNEPPAILDATIQGLLETTPPAGRELIVVDDASSTPVTCSRPEVVVVRNSEPAGTARSRRRGASLAGGAVLVWLDAHMSFAPDWLDRMLAHLDSRVLLCSEFWNYERTICHSWGADYAWCGKRDYAAQQYPGFAVRHRTRFPGAGAVEVPMIIGACYMMLGRGYRELGGFSPLLRVWGGLEQDLSARAWIAGFSVRCVVGARVGHLCRSRFPYPVRFDHLEFNRLATVLTVFEARTASALAALFEPVPPQVRRWLDETDIAGWRRLVQANRRRSDAGFFARFAPELELEPAVRDAAAGTAP